MRAKVYLNIYDMTPHNKYTYPFGFGVFHGGVEVFGQEFSFGGHEYNFSGIFKVTPRQGPPGVTFRESIEMGEVEMTRAEVTSLMVSLGEKYTGRSYNLLTRNCNHFAEEVLEILCNQRLPGWVNRLAGLGSMIPCLIDTGMESTIQPPTAPVPEDRASAPPVISAPSTVTIREVHCEFEVNTDELNEIGQVEEIDAADQDEQEKENDQLRPSS